MGFEQADKVGFWEQSKREMAGKMHKFNQIWDELGLPVSNFTTHLNCTFADPAPQYSDPEGGYFVLVNMAKVKLPADYGFPPHVANRPRDFKLSWFLIMEVGVAAIPPTEFYTPGNAHLAEDYLRFAFCKNDDVLETAKERLRSLKKYIQD